jgi:uncharacterized protein (TIGR01732 family)
MNTYNFIKNANTFLICQEVVMTMSYESYGGGYSGGMGSSFVLIVVLFILLIIVGASFSSGY